MAERVMRLRDHPDVIRTAMEPDNGGPRRFRVLVASTGPADVMYVRKIMRKLKEQGNLAVRGVVEHRSPCDSVDIWSMSDIVAGFGGLADLDLHDQLYRYGARLSNWADLLILAPIDANNLAKLLHGMTDNLLLSIVRSWNVSKKILLVPGMSYNMWENPMTKKQISKLRRKWTWVRVMQPSLWHYDEKDPSERVVIWDGFDELIEATKNQADLDSIGHDLDMVMDHLVHPPKEGRTVTRNLPPEIWSMILQFVGDWETAKALGIYTSLPTPPEWNTPRILDESQSKMRELEWILLCGTRKQFSSRLLTGPQLPWLSSLCVKLIIKFSRTDILSYLESEHKELFWTTFGHTLLPTKASAVYPRPEILDWWRNSPSFLAKEYTHEAIDGASKAGFIQILDWWRYKSGLPLLYTESALEQASSRGHTIVLNWWRMNASMAQGGFHVDGDAVNHEGVEDISSSTSSNGQPLHLKVGKSISYAAQSNQADVIRWWDSSGIPYAHEETVAKIASVYGHVEVLRVWKELKGEKMIFDNQVLVGPTRNGHRQVLQFWKDSGFRVEYKTCDIEEALEDSIGGEREVEVRAWWAKNGLNLGVGTSEWMKVKIL